MPLVLMVVEVVLLYCGKIAGAVYVAIPAALTLSVPHEGLHCGVVVV